MMVLSVANKYEDARADALRERCIATFGGDEIPVPVEAIAEDVLGLRIEEAELGDCSGKLLPAERLILLNAAERAAGRNDPPLRRQRFTIAHEIGHWICHALGSSAPQTTYCRAQDMANDVDRVLEREANVFAAELLMPEDAVREEWAGREALSQEEWVAGVSARLDVSPSAMGWMVFNLGLVAEQPA